MLSGNNNSAQNPSGPAGDEKASLTPLILFAASPGTITGVITVAASHKTSDFPVTALIAVATAVTVMWLVLLALSSSRKAPAKSSFLRDTVTRFMGLIVVAMGVQFALTGYRAFMRM